MIQIERILCPIDYSACSRRAFKHALSVARWYRASVTALHVSTRRTAEPASERGSLLVARSTRQHREADLRHFISNWPESHVPIDIRLAEGAVATQILEAARELKSELMVMGIHGRMSVRYIALGTLGSVTQEVVRNARCPVMVVPPTMRASSDIQYQHILCPVDFGPASLNAVEYALSLAQESGATLVLLYVMDSTMTTLDHEVFDTRPQPLPEDEARHRLAALVPSSVREYCGPIEMVATGMPCDQILRIAEGLQIDAIVMGIGARSAAEVMLLGSTTDQVLRRATVPVLVVPAGAQ